MTKHVDIGTYHMSHRCIEYKTNLEEFENYIEKIFCERNAVYTTMGHGWFGDSFF